MNLQTNLKVIPLKLFYYQTFFETWRNEHSWYEQYKNAIKKWGHRACLRVSRLLKWGYLYWLCVKSLNHLHTELNLGYLKGTKFCLESKASFIDISSIASFKPFLIAWLREYCTFSDSSVVNLKSLSWPKYTQLGTSFQKKTHVLLSNFFSSSNMFFIRLFLANTWKKNRGSPCSFKRKGEFIPLSSLVWGKSLTFCTCTRSCARADDAKIVRSRDAQCNTKELP